MVTSLPFAASKWHNTLPCFPPSVDRRLELIAAVSSAPEQTLHYKILAAGRMLVRKSTPTVLAVTSTRPSNTTIVAAVPKIAAHYILGENSSPQRTEITGNDYLKAPVDERFVLENGIGTWKSTSENGHAPAPGFYISNNGPAAESAFLVGALLKAKGPVKLFPAGEARVERMTDVTLESNGQKQHVTEYAITGLSFEPQTVWLDDDLHFFAVPGKWFAIMREGWEVPTISCMRWTAPRKMPANGSSHEDLAQHPAHPIAIEHVQRLRFGDRL